VPIGNTQQHAFALLLPHTHSLLHLARAPAPALHPHYTAHSHTTRTQTHAYVSHAFLRILGLRRRRHRRTPTNLILPTCPVAAPTPLPVLAPDRNKAELIPPSLCWPTLTLQTPACTHKRTGKILDVVFLRHNAAFCCSLGEEFSSWVRSPLSVPPFPSGPCPALPVLLGRPAHLLESSGVFFLLPLRLLPFSAPFLYGISLSLCCAQFGSPLSACPIPHISLVGQYLVATSLSPCIAQ
jgi:hypothetical protein